MSKRHYQSILNEIETILLEDNLDSDFKRLKNKLMGASTGLEYLSIATSGLLYMKENNSKINKLVGKLINELIAYCKQNGIYPIAKEF